MKTILISYAVKEEFTEINDSKNNIIYVRTGVGKTKSVFHLAKKIEEVKPDFVLNIGTAGTISHHIGDIFIATHFVDRDYQAIKLPGIEYEIEGLQFIRNYHKLRSWLSEYPLSGTCSTGDTFVTEISTFPADIVDMEAYAQAYVCKELAIPFLSVKYITDIIGENSVEHWENKLEDARKGLTEWFVKHNILSLITD